jgi:hypothetical protein
MPAIDVLRMRLFSLSAQGTVADQQQAGAGRVAPDRVEGGQHQRQVLFRRQAADVSDHQIVTGGFQAARRASLRRAGLNSRVSTPRATTRMLR